MIEIIGDLAHTMFIASVMVVALTFSMYGIELFKRSLLDHDLLAQIDPSIDEYSEFIDIFINTISLAFLARNDTIVSYLDLLHLLNNENIDN